MSAYVSPPITHGRKTWYHLTADTEKEIEYFARRLRLDIHGGEYSKCGLHPHLDLDDHDRELALRYGAMEEGE